MFDPERKFGQENNDEEIIDLVEVVPSLTEKEVPLMEGLEDVSVHKGFNDGEAGGHGARKYIVESGQDQEAA